MEKTHFDYLVIGAGPSGLQMGYYLEKANRDYLLLEAGKPGEFYRHYPRHRTMISSNKTRTGYTDPERSMRFDWNSLLTDDFSHLLGSYTTKYFPPADSFVQYMEDFQKKFGIKVRTETRVTRVSRDANQLFRLETAKGEVLTARVLIVATGNSKPYQPPIPGIEHAENYTEMSIDPMDFDNQRVLILGKGNSAFETGDNLVETTALIHLASPNPLKLAWATHFPGHLRAVNNNLLDTYQLKTQNALLDAIVLGIEPTADGKKAVTFKYAHAHDEVETIVYDHVLVCTGFRFDASIFDESCRPKLTLNDRYPQQTSTWESVNVPDLYIAGAMTAMRDYKKTNSAFIHGFRYNVRALFQLLEQKYQATPLPVQTVPVDAAILTKLLADRINTSSAMWQQFGFLGDALVLTADGAQARYFRELPVDYIHESELGKSQSYFVLTLEFGKHRHGDPFSVVRNPNPAHASDSFFLHPVIRHCSGGEVLSEHHLLENLFGEWTSEEEHLAPLREFMRRKLTPGGNAQSVM